jgi:preprotein translocase subunit Sec63
MNYFKEITKAREILELPEKIAAKDLPKHYKKLLSLWHPDTCQDTDKSLCEEKTKKIILAYKFLYKYAQNFMISFTREDVDKNTPRQERLKHQFEKYNFL